MLPDLPGLKQDMLVLLEKYLRAKNNKQLGVLGELPKHYMHEGSRMRIIRENGTVEETKLKEVKGEMSFKVSEIPKLTLNDRIANLDEVASEMADQMATHSYKTLSEGLDKTGHVIDNRGQPFGPETIFAVLEKIYIDFDDNGKHDLTIVVPPDLIPKVQELMSQLETDPELKKRYAEIMERKREEWRDREAARKLVG